MQWHMKKYEVLDSTNLEARRTIEYTCAEQSLHGLVVMAEQQTNGKGRMGRAWASSAGAGLWFSVVIKPAVPLAQASLYSFVAAVAVAEAIRQETALQVQLKWPNDVLLNGRKLCGILLELVPCAKNETYIIIGIGVNVNQQKSEFPDELQDKAVSIAMAAHQQYDCLALLSPVLQKLDENCMLLEREGFAPLREKWKQLSCMIGQTVSVQPKGAEAYIGVSEDLAMDGTLLVRTQNGVIPVMTGDVSLRAKDGGYSF